MNKLQVRFVVFRYKHHSPHSGYSRLAEYGMNHFGGEVIQVSKPLSPTLIRERMLWRLASGTPGYDRSSMAAELNVIIHLLHEKNWIYHFLYGETTYHYVGKLNNYRKNRIIATFHLPPVGMRKAMQIDWHIRQLSAIICVGRNQEEFFDGKFDRERIFFVPLGVDVEYYTPPQLFENRNPDLCLVVGENYRDYPTLRGVIELVAYIRPTTQFIVVSPRRTFELIGTHPNLNFLSGIPESEFLSLYRTATLMVMPLLDTTANNAVLESMACGLPLVVSDVGGIRDYVNPQSVCLVPPNDARRMAEAVVDLLDRPAERQQISVKAREQALKYSWFEVMKRLDSVYSAIV